jgi:acetoin utilization deacetylase AcuC-like enzyme
MLRDAVVASGLVSADSLHEPARASVDDVRLVHTDRYVRAIVEGTLSENEQRRIGLPWSESLVERSFRAVGGTCEAARAALDTA